MVLRLAGKFVYQLLGELHTPAEACLGLLRAAALGLLDSRLLETLRLSAQSLLPVLRVEQSRLRFELSVRFALIAFPVDLLGLSK